MYLLKAFSGNDEMRRAVAILGKSESGSALKYGVEWWYDTKGEAKAAERKIAKVIAAGRFGGNTPGWTEVENDPPGRRGSAWQRKGGGGSDAAHCSVCRGPHVYKHGRA